MSLETNVFNKLKKRIFQSRLYINPFSINNFSICGEQFATN